MAVHNSKHLEMLSSPLGDATMITVKVGTALVSVKADKNFRASIGEKINISVPAGICHLFDTQTGARIEV